MKSLSVADTIIVSLRSVITVFVIYLFGILLAGKFRKVDRKGLQTISSITACLFVPTFYIARLGETFTMELLYNVWTLPLVYMLVILQNALISYLLLIPLAKCPRELKVWFALGQYISNVLALPLLVMPSICSQIQFETTLVSKNETPVILSDAQCLIISETYLIMNIILSQFLYWIFVFPFVGGVSGETSKVVQENTQTLTDTSVRTAQDSRNSLQELALEDSFATTSTPQGSSSEPKEIAGTSRTCKSSCRYFLVALLKPAGIVMLSNVIEFLAQIIGCLIGLVPALNKAFFQSGGLLEPVGAAIKSTAAGLAPVVNLAMSATLGLQSTEMTMSSMLSACDELGVQQRTYLSYVLGRMVILPGINFAFIYLIQDYLLPKDQLVRLIVYSVLATPSANLHVVIANIVGDHRGASFLAKGAFYQYLIGIFTFAVYLFLSVLVSSQF